MEKVEGRGESGWRADIDGLRAIAVLAVIGYHAFPSRAPGGFVGVDIFFVISGFLISTIIFRGLESEGFRFSEFYARRIKRIFPALLLVLAACYAMGWASLLADEYKQLGKHVAAGAGFASNLVLWSESGYFDNSAATKPLLHLWSLGIEEQFYLAWPLIAWLASRFRFNLFIFAALLAASSFALCVAGPGEAAAFYSPLARVWELLIGSLLAWIALRGVGSRAATFAWLRDAAPPLGAALIAIGIFAIAKDDPFPGWRALLPTVGAALAIAAGPRAWLNRTVLASRPLVAVGLISYPLYLWHWPLLSFARILQSGPPSNALATALVAASCLLAWATYKLVEKPIRFGKKRRLVPFALAALMAALGSAGLYADERNGIPDRAVVALNPATGSGSDGGDQGHSAPGCGLVDTEAQKLFQNCEQDQRQAARFALLGDSKAAALYPGLVRTSGEGERWLFMGGNNANGAVVPVASDREIYKKYQTLSRIALDGVIANKNIEKVALVAATRSLFDLKYDRYLEDLEASPNFDDALEGLDRYLARLVSGGKKVVLVVDNPTLPPPEDCINRATSLPILNPFLFHNARCLLPLTRHRELLAKYRALLDAAQKRYRPSVAVFDTTSLMCDLQSGICPPFKDGRLLYSYTDHISDYAAGLIGKGLNRLMAAF